ncbi:ATP-binding protein [Streptomyces griseochromogenes]|uniref:ATP-binding protein n=1 Tax=Streptomyces griseochromogenes TaxID=68214 RepID=UPI0037948613
MSVIPASFCWVPALEDAPPTPPTPEGLTYSLTLPAAPQSPAIARAATHTILLAHDLEDVSEPAVQVAGELTGCACRFTPAADVYMSLRYRDDALRVILYDGHPRHTHARLATACDSRRRDTLGVLAGVVRACQGDWGFGEAREPGGGTRMWAVLPRAGAEAYAKHE